VGALWLPRLLVQSDGLLVVTLMFRICTLLGEETPPWEERKTRERAERHCEVAAPKTLGGGCAKDTGWWLRQRDGARRRGVR
jgi:hypothetical protein